MALPMKSMKKAAPAMKAAGKAMKTMKKAMKAMKKSKIARGKMAKSLVLRGNREKTSGGLSKADVKKNKNGKVVSKKASERARKRYATSGLKKWIESVQAARKALGVTGFLAVNGKSAQGKAVYAKAKALYAA